MQKLVLIVIALILGFRDTKSFNFVIKGRLKCVATNDEVECVFLKRQNTSTSTTTLVTTTAALTTAEDTTEEDTTTAATTTATTITTTTTTTTTTTRKPRKPKQIQTKPKQVQTNSASFFSRIGIPQNWFPTAIVFT